MTRRTQRVGSLLRDALGRLILTELSDPRIDPARTSVIRVEVPEDLMTAKVFVSVLGDDALQRQARGVVVPDSFTHGSSAQRVTWFKRGISEGKVSACNTFAAKEL